MRGVVECGIRSEAHGRGRKGLIRKPTKALCLDSNKKKIKISACTGKPVIVVTSTHFSASDSRKLFAKKKRKRRRNEGNSLLGNGKKMLSVMKILVPISSNQLVNDPKKWLDS